MQCGTARLHAICTSDLYDAFSLLCCVAGLLVGLVGSVARAIIIYYLQLSVYLRDRLGIAIANAAPYEYVQDQHE